MQTSIIPIAGTVIWKMWAGNPVSWVSKLWEL